MTAQPPLSLALFRPCDGCGEAAGLPAAGAPSLSYCPACSALEALRGAARAQLEDLAGPVVGAWASSWRAAGLSLEELEEMTEQVSGAGGASEYAQRVRRVTLHRLMRAHPLPPVEAVALPPARVGFDFAALPYVVAFYPTDPRPGRATSLPSPVFGDSTGRILSGPFLGLDTLTLTLPHGVRAVLHVAQGGSFPRAPASSPEEVGYRVPADLWPVFEVYLSGRENWGQLPAHGVWVRTFDEKPAPPAPALPVLIACRQEAGRAALLADRAGQVFEYLAPLPCPHRLTAGPRGHVLTLHPEDPTRAASFEIWPDLLPQVRRVFSSPEEGQG